MQLRFRQSQVLHHRALCSSGKLRLINEHFKGEGKSLSFFYALVQIYDLGNKSYAKTSVGDGFIRPEFVCCSFRRGRRPRRPAFAQCASVGDGVPDVPHQPPLCKGRLVLPSKTRRGCKTKKQSLSLTCVRQLPLHKGALLYCRGGACSSRFRNA